MPASSGLGEGLAGRDVLVPSRSSDSYGGPMRNARWHGLQVYGVSSDTLVRRAWCQKAVLLGWVVFRRTHGSWRSPLPSPYGSCSDGTRLQLPIGYQEIVVKKIKIIVKTKKRREPFLNNPWHNAVSSNGSLLAFGWWSRLFSSPGVFIWPTVWSYCLALVLEWWTSEQHSFKKSGNINHNSVWKEGKVLLRRKRS
jgi:hypothetical protein